VLRRVLLLLLTIAFVLIAAVFAYSNPQPIAVDVGVARLENVSLAVAFIVVFALGWLFGLLTAAFALWRSAAERRRLRRDLRYTETELQSLRAAPVPDAD
jgi:uncharacterized membrane protein YciS (DUF1049 family)